MKRNKLTIAWMLIATLTMTGFVSVKAEVKPLNTYHMKHKQVNVNGISIFYREAGDPNAETIVMLHGFPSSSHMFRDIIPALAEKYHVIAPDYPGFGLSESPSMETFDYTFDNIAMIMEAFLDQLHLNEYYLMMQDYGGPVGMRIAVKNEEKIKGLIIQNANMYMEGLGEWSQKVGGFIQNNETEKLMAFKDHLMSPQGIKEQYTTGAGASSQIDPVSYLTDIAFMDRENARAIQTNVFLNYGSNFPKYPEWQQYLKSQQPPVLVLWGQNDKFFSAEGGRAYEKDLDNVEVHFFEGGHFMLEEYSSEAVALVSEFLNKQNP